MDTAEIYRAIGPLEMIIYNRSHLVFQVALPLSVAGDRLSEATDVDERIGMGVDQ